MKLVSYLQGVLLELRKVTWPTAPTLVKYFVSVVLGIAVATLIVGVMDLGFIKLLGYII